jgi:LPS-assembly protein
MRMRHLIFTFSLSLLAATQAKAQPAFDENKPVFVQADKLGYDTKNAIVVARGNVLVAQGNTRMRADQLTYYQNQQVVRADGNVRILDANTGEEYVADRVQLKDDLKAGIIRNFHVRMADNSQFAAREARKISPTQTTMKQAVYSPCKVCKEGQAPFWQLKSSEVHIDEDAQVVEHEDTRLEVFGVPVLYTPYFFHPTPDADRKSGFIKPEYSQTSNLGTVVKTPYYINISPDKDATITPILTTKEGPVLDGEYRQRTNNGRYEFKGSVTYPDKRDELGAELAEREVRGHIFAKGEEQIATYWRSGFDVQRATDDTYLRRYDYGNYRSLSSRVYVEGAKGRNYAIAQGLTFQGLQANDDPDREPLVLPLAEGYVETDPRWNGSRFFTSANTQTIARDEGAESRRLSITGGWKLPVVTSGGHLIDLTSSLRGDVYSIDNQTLANGSRFDGEETRMIPQMALKWRYPLMKMVGTSNLTIEPTVLAIAQSNGNNPEEIPNEDNRIVEFTDANLFNLNPFPGYDTVDEGSRVAYGVRGQWLFDQGQNLQFLLGQNYLTEEDTPYPYTSRGDEHFSDYVGRVWLDYQPVFVGYHFRLDQESGEANSNTFSTGFNIYPVDWRIDYISLENDRFLQDREEILTSMGLALTEQWRINGSARRDLIEDGMTFAGVGLVFQNECFTLLTSFARQFTRDRDVEPDTSLTVRVSFKNLNEI